MSSDVRILIAEDEFLIAENVKVALETAGFAVRAVPNGADAISCLDTTETVYRALVTDIRMGSGPNGWDVARHAREVDPAFPIIYMSGDSAHEHAVHGVPGSIMVQKPFADGQIITAVSTLLNDVSATAATDAT